MELQTWGVLEVTLQFISHEPIEPAGAAVERNLLYYGDSLEVLRRYIKDETVDLVYLDPPFKSDQDFNGARVLAKWFTIVGSLSMVASRRGARFRRQDASPSRDQALPDYVAHAHLGES